MTRVYLDHNATSPLRPEARAALREAVPFANASSLHTEGRQARAAVEEARERVAGLLRARPREVVFTSGGTEAIAAAIHGVCASAPASAKRLVATAVEHSAVLHATAAAERRGFAVRWVPVDRDGCVDPERFIRELEDRSVLAIAQAANPESGVLQPVDAIAAACRARRVPLLVDAVQAVGKIAVPDDGIPGDLVAVSAHKIGGPQGAGALVVRERTPMEALIPGIQERRRRGGTEAVALLAAFGAAAEVAGASLAAEAARLAALCRTLERALRAEPIGATIHGAGADRLPNTVLFSVPGIPGETLSIAADLAGFAVSTGSACASGAVEPSHVLRAMGLAPAEARGAVRVSLGWTTREEDVAAFVAALPGWCARARG
jgi:cysteine desulfurase